MDIEISEKLANLFLLGIIVVYTISAVPELFVDECSGVGDCFDFDRRMSRIAIWDLNWIVDDFRHTIHMSLLVFSQSIFGNPKVLVLASSVLLLVVTYLLAFNLTKKRIGALVAVLVVLQSYNFWQYDTSATYPSFWALLFVTSLYLITTKWYLSPIPYSLSIPAKGITILFFPALLLFTWFCDLDRSVRKKIIVLYLGTACLLLGLLFSVSAIFEAEGGYWLFKEPDWYKFGEGFVSWVWKGFAQDQITIIMLLFATFILATKMSSVPNVKAILLLCYGLVFTSPILIGLTTYDVWPYRMLVHVVVIGIMVGFLASYPNWIYSFLGKARSSSIEQSE